MDKTRNFNLAILIGDQYSLDFAASHGHFAMLIDPAGAIGKVYSLVTPQGHRNQVIASLKNLQGMS